MFVGSTAGSSLGWYAGAPIGIMTAFFGSMVGLGAGMWGGAWLARRWMP